MELHHQNSDLGPTDRIKPHSCVKKKRTKGKKRARDASGTEEDNGARQIKRKKGKGSKGRNSGALPPTQSVTDKASWGSNGTRNLERRVLEDITNRVLHAVTWGCKQLTRNYAALTCLANYLPVWSHAWTYVRPETSLTDWAFNRPLLNDLLASVSRSISKSFLTSSPAELVA